MRFVCEHCQRVLTVDAVAAGQSTGCTHCGQTTAVPAERVAPRAVLGDFALERLLGHGNTGTVYLARQLSVRRPAAVKVLRGRLTPGSPVVLDLYREAQLSARFDHPNIARPILIDAEDGLFFSAMEFVDGQTLLAMVEERGRLATAIVLKLVRQVADALEFAWAHEQLVYRAVNPRSIMVTKAGSVKLTDFSLAYTLPQLDAADAQAIAISEYSSPEDVRQAAADVRSDLYALGATMFFALTGQVPHGGEYPEEIGRRLIDVPVASPREHVPDCPEPVCRIVAKLLQLEAAARYQTPAELLRDLDALDRGRPVLA